MTTIADLVAVTLIYDAALGSPIETQPLGGKILLLDPSMFPLPSRGDLFDQPGFSRQNPSTTAWEWVMGGTVDPVDQFIDSLTGKGLWLNQTSRTTVKTLAQQLFSAGIPKNTIATRLPQFYNAVAAEILAEQAAA